jgi:RNA polymerase sigma-70 factor, ECF subfamily
MSLPFRRGSPAPRLRLVAGGSAPDSRAEDDALVRDFEEGRSGAGARLYDRLLPVVDGTLVRVLGRRELDHPDLVQSAFEQIVSTLSKRRFGRACSLAGWASVLTCHVALNALRSRQRERRVVDRDRGLDAPNSVVAPAGAHPEAQLRARDDLATVRQHLAEMDPHRVTALLLHAQGYDLAEIAVLTHTSVAAAQSRLSRGRREVVARLKQDSPANDPPTPPARTRP